MARTPRISNAAILREAVVCARTHGVTAETLRNVALVLNHGAALPGMRFFGREVRRAIASHLQSIADEMDDADRRKADTLQRLRATLAAAAVHRRATASLHIDVAPPPAMDINTAAARRFVADEALALTVTRPADLAAGAALASSPAPTLPLTLGDPDSLTHRERAKLIEEAMYLPPLIDGVMDSDGYGIRPGYRYTVLPDPRHSPRPGGHKEGVPCMRVEEGDTFEVDRAGEDGCVYGNNITDRDVNDRDAYTCLDPAYLQREALHRHDPKPDGARERQPEDLVE